MKKALLIFLGIIVLLLGILFAIPIFFKDEIKAKIDKELAKTINGKVLYDPDKFSLSFFRNFPNATITMDDFGLISNVEEFKGDTLFRASNFSATADIMSIIGGDVIKLKGIYLKQPKIVTMFAKNGKNSWDFMITDPADTLAKPAEPSNFKMAIEKWEIEDGTIIYEDESLPMYAELRHVTHSGRGDMTLDIFDVDTKTKSPETLLIFDGITYLDKHSVDANMKMNINVPKAEYKFLENDVRINDFDFGFDGLIAMPTSDIYYDMTFKAKETEFKHLISLIPAVFLEDYKDLKTDGKISFDGMVKGTQSETSLPGFGLNLKIDNAMMQYPKLPTSVSNIMMDLSINNPDGVIDNTVINLKKFHMDMGKNPVDGRILVEGLNPYKVDANILAKVNLADITTMFPIEGTTLKGLYNVDMKAKGMYSDSLKLMPVVDAKMSIANGYVKTKDFPSALENLNFNATVYSAGQMSSTQVLVENFKMLLDGEQFTMRAFVKNLDDPNYDVNLKGIVDLTKLTKIYPMEGMTLAGRINADISTKGVMSDVEAGRYDKTSTSGTMAVSDFVYNSADMPQGMKLSNANFSLSPEKMVINNMRGSIGKSDMDIKGYFSNYMGYMFGKVDTIIRGNMTFASNRFDVNEWMTEDASPSPGTQEETAPFEVPKDIDFVLASTINEVLYDNMTMKNMTGNVIMKDGIVRLDKLTFNMLGGSFLTNGTYDSRDLQKPKFDFDMNIDKIAIKEAFTTFSMIQKFAPIAKNMEGNFSTNLKLNGFLGKDMMPLYNTLTGAGIAEVLAASLQGNKVLSGIAGLTKLKDLDPMLLKNILMKFDISDGKIKIKPFDVNAGPTKMNISGSNGIDGSLDYIVKMDVPAKLMGSSVNTALSGLTGKDAATAENIKLDLSITGTHDSPKVSLIGSSLKDQAKDVVKDIVKEQVKDQLKNNPEIQKAKEQADKYKEETEAKIRAEKERLQKEAEAKAKADAEKAIKNKLKDKIKF